MHYLYSTKLNNQAMSYTNWTIEKSTRKYNGKPETIWTVWLDNGFRVFYSFASAQAFVNSL